MLKKQQAKEFYEDTWDRVGSKVLQQIESGNDRCQSVTSACHAQAHEFLCTQPFIDYYKHVGIRFDSNHRPTKRIIVKNGRYQLTPFAGTFRDGLVASTLSQFLASQTDKFDCVVELGSGIGKNLFALFNSMRETSRDLPMHACEFTDKGRQVTDALWQADTSMPLSIHPFDYYEPDLSFLEPDQRVLFFTVHSIEQIPELSRAVLDQMLDRTRHCTCFHFEPVGWQTNDQLMRSRLNGCTLTKSRDPNRRQNIFRNMIQSVNPFSRRRQGGFPGVGLDRRDIGSSRMVSANAAVWSAQAGYNTNLVQLLKTFQMEKRIEIQSERVDQFGSNPFNPTTVIQWTGSGTRADVSS